MSAVLERPSVFYGIQTEAKSSPPYDVSTKASTSFAMN